MTKFQTCPACKGEYVYNADIWKNYSFAPGARTVYVCGNCAPPEGEQFQQKVKDIIEGKANE